MTNWKFINSIRQHAHRTNAQGFYESITVSALPEGTVIDEPDASAPEPYRQYTGRDKFDIFTPDEQRAIAGAAMTDVDVKLFYDRFTIADYITYDDPEMVLGLEFMEQRGFLTPERHAAVVAEMTR